MPNHITNKVTAPVEVLRAMLNEEGFVDFNKVIPFTGHFPWQWINGDAETAAETVAAEPLHENPLIAGLQRSNRSGVDITKLSDESFEQFVQMLRNKRACGFLHSMDFARNAWGTKWNAYDQELQIEEGRAQFDTAWSCPVPVFKALSKLHPAAEIVVQFADEDIGSNCGTITFKGGEMVAQDVAGNWNAMTSEEQAKWRSFAYDVKGWEPEEDAD